jgi:predicted adenine nucleotide alpha hydrolase (AANH) superfamily ATPase
VANCFIFFKKKREEVLSFFLFSLSFFSPVFYFAGTTFFFPLVGNFFEASNKIQEFGSSFILAKKLPTKHQKITNKIQEIYLVSFWPQNYQQNTTKSPTKLIKEIYLVTFWPKNYQQNSKKSPTKSKNHRNRPVAEN